MDTSFNFKDPDHQILPHLAQRVAPIAIDPVMTDHRSNWTAHKVLK